MLIDVCTCESFSTPLRDEADALLHVERHRALCTYHVQYKAPFRRRIGIHLARFAEREIEEYTFLRVNSQWSSEQAAAAAAASEKKRGKKSVTDTVRREEACCITESFLCCRYREKD